jgi:hypothetical protein
MRNAEAQSLNHRGLGLRRADADRNARAYIRWMMK